MNLGIAMLPACILGYLCHGMIKQYLFGPKTVIIGLVIGGLFMIFAEKKRKYFLVENIDQITSQQAFKIGLFQCLSLWPGFSRSGSTIAGSLLVGVSRKAAADFSFIMAVPLMCIAWQNIYLWVTLAFYQWDLLRLLLLHTFPFFGF